MAETELELELDEGQSLELALGEGFPLFVKDYNILINKPQIEGVELMGNVLLSDLFPEGLIIDGGTSEGADDS